jgi:hypothetical protein
MTTVRYGRAYATNPGKHGPRDWRIVIGNTSPTIGELVFMLGMLYIAEDRYGQRNHLGRYLPAIYIDLLCTAKSPERVIAVAEDADA